MLHQRAGFDAKCASYFCGVGSPTSQLLLLPIFGNHPCLSEGVATALHCWKTLAGNTNAVARVPGQSMAATGHTLDPMPMPSLPEIPQACHLPLNSF